jgi:histone H1/5
MADIKNQKDLDALFKAAVQGKNQAALKTLKKLMEDGEIHFPKGEQRPVFGAAPKVEQAVNAAENLPTGPASKKKLTAADRAEMKAAEKRAKKIAEAQKALDQKALEDLQKQRAAEKADAAIAREKATEEVKKPVASLPPKTSAAEQAEAQQSLEQARAKKQAPKEGFEIAKPSRQEQQAKMEAMKRGAKKTPTVEGIAKKTVKDVEIVNAVDAEGNIVYNDFAEEVKQLKQKGSPEDLLKALRAQNFKEDWGRSTKAVRDRVLRNTFGPQALSLNVATQNKLGELAFARQAFEQSGLQSLPDMDDKLKSFDTLVETIKDSAVRDPKGVEQRVANLHGKMLTATGGKLRLQDLEFRKPRPGEVGSDKSKPENPVQKVSPGFETAKRAQVPVEARNLAAAAKKKPMDAGAPAAAAGETPATPSGKKPMDTGVSEPVPSTPTGKRPMDAGPAPKTAAAPSAAAPAAEAAKSPYMQTVLADPAKYGAQKDRATWTKEQKAARKALADQLGLNTPEARAVKKAADAAADPEMAEVKKRYGEAVRSNPSKYGRSNKKATDAQKAAKKDLFSKLTEQVKTEFAAKTPVAAAAAASAAPTAPAKPSAVKAAAPTGTLADVLGPTKMGAPAAKAAVPAAPAAAPAAVPAPAAAAAAEMVEKKKAGPWKKGAMRSGLGARKGAEAVKQRLGQITGGAGAGGAMRFLGPLFGAFAAYQLLDMARQGTVGEADQRRMKALETLSGVSGGMQQDAASREQMRQMQRMVDLAAIQRQQSLDQMRQQYTGDQALDAILRGQQSSLAALAVPSQPSIAEMMARY